MAKKSASPFADRNMKIRKTLQRTDFPSGVAHDDGLIHRSGRRGAVNTILRLCEKIIKGKGGTRKDLLTKCRKLGIADNTTLHHHWCWKNPKAAKAIRERAAAKRAAAKAAKSK